MTNHWGEMEEKRTSMLKTQATFANILRLKSLQVAKVAMRSMILSSPNAQNQMSREIQIHQSLIQ
jgi:hypothetical protein